MAELADAADSKYAALYGACRFNSCSRHQFYWGFRVVADSPVSLSESEKELTGSLSNSFIREATASLSFVPEMAYRLNIALVFQFPVFITSDSGRPAFRSRTAALLRRS